MNYFNFKTTRERGLFISLIFILTILLITSVLAIKEIDKITKKDQELPASNEYIKDIESSVLPLLLTKYELGSVIQQERFGGICSAGHLILGISDQGEGYFLNLETGLIKPTGLLMEKKLH